MHIEVDQSGKIEQTAVNTVLAFSDGEQCALLIPAKVKRQALAYLRDREKSRRSSILLVFSAALFLLLKEIAEQITLVIIDREYEGHEATIRGRLLQLLREADLQVHADAIAFGSVGRKSEAHYLAWRVHKGEISPDHQVTLSELLEVL